MADEVFCLLQCARYYHCHKKKHITHNCYYNCLHDANTIKKQIFPIETAKPEDIESLKRQIIQILQTFKSRRLLTIQGSRNYKF